MYYKITKNGQDRANALTKDEAIKKLATIVDAAAMETNFYLTDENCTVTDPDSKKVIFEEGDESAIIGDDTFEIVEDNE